VQRHWDMAKKTNLGGGKEVADDKGLLQKTAKTLGSALGSVAAKTGLGGHDPQQSRPGVINGKFQKRGKHRLPRRLKKLEKNRSQALAG
jgi:hypothetical protein